MIDTGLRSIENPTYGGWGGRFDDNEPLHKNTVLDYNPATEQFEASYSLTRWFDDIQNDFANRVGWTLTNDDSAVNHAPSVSVTEGIDIKAKAGEEVTLTAVGEDQDGDELTYKWWRYFEADTYQDSEITTKEEIYDIGLQIDITRKLGKDEKVNTIEI